MEQSDRGNRTADETDRIDGTEGIDGTYGTEGTEQTGQTGLRGWTEQREQNSRGNRTADETDRIDRTEQQMEQTEHMKHREQRSKWNRQTEQIEEAEKIRNRETYSRQTDRQASQQGQTRDEHPRLHDRVYRELTFTKIGIDPENTKIGKRFQRRKAVRNHHETCRLCLDLTEYWTVKLLAYFLSFC